MLQSIVITIPRTRSSPDDLEVHAAWFANQLAAEQVIAKVGYSVTRRRTGFEVAGVLGYHHPDWDVLKSAPCRRALQAAGLKGQGMKVEVSPAPLGADGEYCGWRVRGDLVLMCDPLGGMPPLRLADGGGFVASHRLKLDARTLVDLWSWDGDFRDTFGLWLRGGLHGAWAGKELGRRDGALNTTGRSLGRRIARETGLRVKFAAEDYAGA